MFRLGLSFLHRRDAGSTVRLAVAIENGQVHEPVVENVSHDHSERLSAVDMRKGSVAGKPGWREQDDAADSRENFGHGSILGGFGCFGCTAVPEMIFSALRHARLGGDLV